MNRVDGELPQSENGQQTSISFQSTDPFLPRQHALSSTALRGSKFFPPRPLGRSNSLAGRSRNCTYRGATPHAVFVVRLEAYFSQRSNSLIQLS